MDNHTKQGKSRDDRQDERIRENAQRIGENTQRIGENAQRIGENTQRIDETSATLKKQTELLQEILFFHKPWLRSPWKTKFRTKFYGPALKILAIVTVWTGAIKTVQWYYNYCKIEEMGREYVHVANRMFYEESNPEIALEFVEKAVNLCEGKAEYKFLRAYIEGLAAMRLLLNLGRPYTKSELDSVHRCYAEAVYLQELEPGRPEPYLLQGQILIALNDYDRAEKAIRTALDLDPQNDYIHVRMGQLMLEKGNAAVARAEFDAALSRNPQSKWAWLWKGVLERTVAKDVQAARKCYQAALAIDPKFDLALYNEGWTWADEKNYAKARHFMQKALKINPAYKEAVYSMGMFYGYENNYPVAKTWMDKSIEMDEKFLEGYKWRGVINWEMKDYESALADYDTAIHLDPMNPDLYRRRAKAFEKIGKTDEAARDIAFMKELESSYKD